MADLKTMSRAAEFGLQLGGHARLVSEYLKDTLVRVALLKRQINEWKETSGQLQQELRGMKNTNRYLNIEIDRLNESGD